MESVVKIQALVRTMIAVKKYRRQKIEVSTVIVQSQSLPGKGLNFNQMSIEAFIVH